MKFQELHLEVAVSRCGVGGDPVSDDQRKALCERVFLKWLELFGDCYFPFTISDVAQAAVRIRKRGTGKAHAWQIAEAHNQWDCFWTHRDKGPCSEEVEAGHVVAAAAGAELTVANGMIECSAHNHQRRHRTIEEYLLSEDNTESCNG